jgi:hypothetical protein
MIKKTLVAFAGLALAAFAATPADARGVRACYMHRCAGLVLSSARRSK